MPACRRRAWLVPFPWVARVASEGTIVERGVRRWAAPPSRKDRCSNCGDARGSILLSLAHRNPVVGIRSRRRLQQLEKTAVCTPRGS